MTFNFQIEINTWVRKLLVVTLTLAACGFMLYRIYGPWRAAWLTRSKIYEPAIYERAIRWNPNNADYHFILGQIYNYSTEHLNVERAREEYEAAVRLNPYRAAHWLELSKFYEQEGNTERSRTAIVMALKMDPNYAQTHWAAANLYIRLNDLLAADFELRRRRIST